MSQAQARAERPLTELVLEVALSGEVELPPLPEMGQKLMHMLQDENADSAHLSEIMMSDQAITAALLKMANSAFFAGLAPVSDLNQAIARLGIRRVGALATTLLHKGQFQSNHPMMKKLLPGLWDHAVCTALTARRLSHLVGGNSEESYLAGLLHDIGKLLVLKAVDHLSMTDPDLEITPPILMEVLEVTHSEIGHRVLTDWNLPQNIARAVLLHHDEGEGLEDPLSLRVQAADIMTKKIGAHPNPDKNLVLEEILAIERLELTDVELATLLVDVEEEMESLKKFL